jgi:hypothetical protein
MKKDSERISELLVETGAYKDLENPVILTSGALGIYYINTEKLVQDGGEFEKYGDNSIDMINHAMRMTEKHPTFKEVIEIIANKASIFLPRNKRVAISGGQRRDWPFSGPVAKKLQIPHLSIYKEGRVSLVTPGGRQALETPTENLQDTYVLHIADLLTEASSCYRFENEVEKGWIPEIRKRNGKIENLIAVVSRLQGGEQRLIKIGVNAEAFVSINENFLRNHSKFPERALDYNKDSEKWTQDYLRENGALILLENFDPNGKNIDRARKFLNRYEEYLAQNNRLEELDSAVNKRYNISLEQISRGVN